MHLAVAAVLVLSGFALLPVPADAPAPLETVYENGTFTFTEKLVVTPGSTLVIRNATVYFDFIRSCLGTRSSLDDDCDGAIEVNGGKLLLDRSTFDTHLSNHSNTFQRPYVLRAKAGVIHIENSTFFNLRGTDFQEPGAERSVVKHSQFIGGRNALKFHRGAAALIEGNLFDGVFTAVQVIDSNSVVRNNHFRGVRDWAVDAQISLVGDKAFRDSLVTIENNLIEDGVSGITTLHGDKNVIRDNVVRNLSKYGLAFVVPTKEDMTRKQFPLVEGNVLDGNRVAMAVYTQPAEYVPVKVQAAFQGNSFLNTRCTEIETSQATGVDLIVHAEGNWWGSADGPQDRSEECPAFTGKGLIYVDPWLTAPPP